jgi:hypothetical protein
MVKDARTGCRDYRNIAKISSRTPGTTQSERKAAAHSLYSRLAAAALLPQALRKAFTDIRSSANTEEKTSDVNYAFVLSVSATFPSRLNRKAQKRPVMPRIARLLQQDRPVHPLDVASTRPGSRAASRESVASR